uniref:Uncharacterized protein n=1 Tax=Glossina brevipalpis TaxID=37001 RepID=A0A1A9WBC1_9MUSC
MVSDHLRSEYAGFVGIIALNFAAPRGCILLYSYCARRQLTCLPDYEQTTGNLSSLSSSLSSSSSSSSSLLSSCYHDINKEFMTIERNVCVMSPILTHIHIHTDKHMLVVTPINYKQMNKYIKGDQIQRLSTSARTWITNIEPISLRLQAIFTKQQSKEKLSKA